MTSTRGTRVDCRTVAESTAVCAYTQRRRWQSTSASAVAGTRTRTRVVVPRRSRAGSGGSRKNFGPRPVTVTPMAAAACPLAVPPRKSARVRRGALAFSLMMRNATAAASPLVILISGLARGMPDQMRVSNSGGGSVRGRRGLAVRAVHIIGRRPDERVRIYRGRGFTFVFSPPSRSPVTRSPLPAALVRFFTPPLARPHQIYPFVPVRSVTSACAYNNIIYAYTTIASQRRSRAHHRRRRRTRVTRTPFLGSVYHAIEKSYFGHRFHLFRIRIRIILYPNTTALSAIIACSRLKGFFLKKIVTFYKFYFFLDIIN